MQIAFLALGTNIGNRKKQIEKAITCVSEKVKVISQGSIYETKPIGYSKQNNFYNTVIEIETELSPKELLLFVKSIEKRVGRKKRFRNGPREIDIDILLYGNYVFNLENLIIPHPRFSERDFVLKPLSDISPNIINPINKKKIIDLLSKIKKENRSIISKID